MHMVLIIVRAQPPHPPGVYDNFSDCGIYVDMTVFGESISILKSRKGESHEAGEGEGKTGGGR